MEGQNKHSLDKFSFGTLFILGFFLPIFFLPIQGVSLDASKAILFSAVALISVSLWLVGRLIDGTFSIPKSNVLLAGLVLAISVLVSSLFSPAILTSIIGQGFESGTFSFVALSIVLFFLSSIFFQTKERIFYFYASVALSSLVIAIFHIIRLVSGADTLSFGLFTSQVSNVVGKWNDMAIFFGLSAFLSILTLEFLTLAKRTSFFTYAIMLVSLFFLALINFTLAWAVLGILSLIVVIYSVYSNRFDPSSAPSFSVQKIRLPIISLLVFVLSLVMFLSSTTVGGYLSTKLNVSQLEVRPSFTATLGIAKDSLIGKKILIGSGANRFSSEWLMHKPDGINSSPFWNTDFNSGFGIVPSSIVTGGLIVFLSWILFLGLFIYAGFRAMFNFSLSKMSRYLIISSFLSATYLLSFIVLYVPNTTIYVLAFIFSGILIAALAKENIIGNYKVTLLGDPKFGFISVLVLIFLLISSVTLAYFFSTRFASYIYFQKSLSSLNTDGNIDKAETYLARAIKLSDQDVYYRANSELALIKLNNLLQKTNIPQDTLRTQFQSILGGAIDSAKKATDLDNTNYSNFVSLGRVYESIVPLNIQGAYESARDTYQKALILNPESPAILLSFARLEIGHNNEKAARAYIEKALAKKSNFTEAVFFLSQIEVRAGNINEAIKRTEEVSLLAPSDVTVFFQLGLLKYNKGDYSGTVTALERAVSLSPNYSNAKYFLGLSYDKLGRKADAIKQFEDIEVLNQDNKEVKSILANLRAGRGAFANVAPPQNKPEKRAKPPIEE